VSTHFHNKAVPKNIIGTGRKKEGLKMRIKYLQGYESHPEISSTLSFTNGHYFLPHGILGILQYIIRKPPQPNQLKLDLLSLLVAWRLRFPTQIIYFQMSSSHFQ
jgi:hypothetical protein